MASLLVRNLENTVVEKLKEEAARQKISTEEAHRRVLRKALLEQPEEKPMPFNEFLLTMPDFPDEYEVFFERQKDLPRPVDLG